jgi:hypothetical protein
MTDKPRILPCPFCGQEPMTSGSGEGQRGLMIECITSGCVNPHVSYYVHAAAIRAWNRRGGVDLKEVERMQANIRRDRQTIRNRQGAK